MLQEYDSYDIDFLSFTSETVMYNLHEVHIVSNCNSGILVPPVSQNSHLNIHNH